MPLTKKLATFVHATGHDDVPEEAYSAAQRCMLDGIGTSLAGNSHPVVSILTEYAEAMGAVPQSSVIGSGCRTSAPLAGMINGAMCHVMDFDDTNWAVMGHLSAVLIPTVLAVGERLRSSGRDVLLAYILGFEVACKISKAMNPGHYKHGYHSTATIGVFGATTAAGKLLNLSPEQLAHSFGICGSRSAGLRANFGTPTKSLHAGLASHDGIFAALLAQLGYGANQEILEAQWGFGDVLGTDANFDAPFQALGNPFDILSTGVVVKQYPTCARTHTAIDAVLQLMNEHGLEASEIKIIRCGSDEECSKICIHPEPATGLQAKFSMPYCLARACTEKALTLDHFTDDKIAEPHVKSLMQRIIHYVEPDIVQKGWEFRAAAKITFELADGRVLQKSINTAKGNPEKPLSDPELIQKFRHCAEDALEAPQMEDLCKMITSLYDLDEVNKLIQLLIVPR